jgi:methyl-galactoside transport system substrate-binding protein
MRKLLSLVLVVFLFGCESASGHVHLFIYNMEDPYIEVLAEEIMELGSAHYGITLHDAQNSQIIQNEMIEEALGQNPRLLIINPVDRLGVYPIIEKAKAAGVPLIFINREPLARDLAISDQAFYVGARAEQSGILQAELVAQLFGGDPQALNMHDKNGDNIIQAIIFKGEQGHQDAELRTTYVVDELGRLGYRLDVLTTEIADWNREVAYLATPALVDAYGESVEVFMSNNDAMALGIIDALIELGYFADLDDNLNVDQTSSTWMPVLGIDGIEQAVSRMQSGHLYATVLNDALAQAEATVELSKTILFGSILGDSGYELVDGRYVWVDYKKFVLDDEMPEN